MGKEGRRQPWKAARVIALPAMFVVLAVALVMRLTTACLDDLPALADAAPALDTGFSEPANPCGDGVVAIFQDGGDAGESCDPGSTEGGILGCTDCHVACTGVLDDAGRHCFQSVGTATSYAEAISLCKAQAAHVVTVGSAREAEIATALADGGAYWLGISYRPAANGYAPELSDEPGCPLGVTSACPGCLALGADDAGELGLHPSVDAATSSAITCLVAGESGARWQRVPCTEVGPFSVVCEREALGKRTSDCTGYFCMSTFATEGRKRYLIQLTDFVTAETAAERCASFAGGRLAIFDSREEREQVAREVAKVLPPPTPTLWIGLSQDAQGNWRWDDETAGDSGRPIVWGTNQPSDAGGDRRAFLRISTEFDTQLAFTVDDAGSNALRGFVCERPP